jgi:hypothetical protein
MYLLSLFISWEKYFSFCSKFFLFYDIVLFYVKYCKNYLNVRFVLVFCS